MSEPNKTKIPNEENLRLMISLIKGMQSSVENLSEQCINIYDPTEVYAKGRACFYEDENGKLGLYVAKNATTGTFNPSSWKEVDTTDLQYLTKEDVDDLFSSVSEETWNYLERIISDESVSVNHAWSSSKTYTELLNSSEELKDYVQTKIAESATPSFEVISSEDEVIDDHLIYLLPKGDGTCGIYVVKDGSPYLVQSSLISFDDYLKITDAENDYLKIADAELKYKDIASYETEIGDMTTLETEATNVVGAINEIKKSVSDGKSSIASAITEKGVATEPDDTFEVMTENILAILGDDIECLEIPYDETKTWNKDDTCIHEDYLYKCQEDNVTGAWDSSKWVRIYLEELESNGGTFNNMVGVSVKAMNIVSDDTYAYIGIPQKGYYDETSKIYVGNNNIGSNIDAIADSLDCIMLENNGHPHVITTDGTILLTTFSAYSIPNNMLTINGKATAWTKSAAVTMASGAKRYATVLITNVKVGDKIDHNIVGSSYPMTLLYL